MKYNFKAIEKKWQKKWEKEKVFKVKGDKSKKKFYIMEMFPYPSALGLHLGHALNYTIGDILARFKRMNGFNVLYPMGFDSLGLPAENAAIQAGKHPRPYTEKAISNYIKQMKDLGLSYDWDKLVNSMEPEYYKWNQLFFLKFLEEGIAYRKKAAVNWCPKCNTVLANEQVVGGCCWRHSDTEVEIKHLEQWFLKITDYADELLDCIDGLEWPQKIKTMQKNWIGKSHGTEIDFEVETFAHEGCTLEPQKTKWKIFTTRPDTLYGVTFMVVSAQHPKLMDLVTADQEKDVKKFLKKIKSVSDKNKGDLEKEGVFTGSYVVNPVNGEKIPLWVGNFVVADYGSGMVMAVPAHDQRDFEFAKKYNLEIKEVIIPSYGKQSKDTEFRKTISAVIHRKKDNKFLLLKWKKFNWVSPVVGGVDEGEDIGKAAEREVLEETGYKTKFIKKLGGEIESHFFADNKNVWRHRIDQPILLELIKDKPSKISKEEGEKHEEVWMGYSEAIREITHEYNKLGIIRFKEGEQAYTGKGKLVNSDKFDDLDSEKAREEITKYLMKKKLGRKAIQFKMRDWLISRQRYWGTPIPIVYCDECGIVPVPEKELPIKLPEKVKFGKGNPLATNKEFVNVKCPKCKGDARRETDTMDTFVDSSWYFMRYPDNKNKKEPFGKKIEEYWLPVDQYIGGIEHATMHLLYARFWTKALRDLGYVNYDEPFTKLFNQGMLHGADGNKMSKSIGNVVLPEVVSEKYGIDTARFFLMSLAAPDKPRNWDDKGVLGSLKFMKKIISSYNTIKIGKSSPKIESKLNSTIKDVTEYIETFKYNLAVIRLRDLFNSFGDEESKDTLEKALKLLSPFCPHICEELWSKLGNKDLISLAKWPVVDEKKIDEKFEKEDQILGTIVKDVIHIKNITGRENETPKAHVYAIPSEVTLIEENKEFLSTASGAIVMPVAVNDKDKHDPEGKAKKAKPGKPGIYLEPAGTSVEI
ncbi:class I tRNA ligase family protein [Candidatus Pacearchaeota archaeon]|nr:class I tRNA ligase family protein [Candidatus Pacearchaeota archaeon]